MRRYTLKRLACKQAHLFGDWCEYLRGGAAICEPAKPATSMGRRNVLPREIIQWSPAQRTLVLYEHPDIKESFVYLDELKAHIFSLKLARLIRTPG